MCTQILAPKKGIKGYVSSSFSNNLNNSLNQSIKNCKVITQITKEIKLQNIFGNMEQDR